MMRALAEMLWQRIARFVARESVIAWLVRRACATPYTHIMSADRSDVYMYRYWLFNPYRTDPADLDGDRKVARWNWLPSVRLHRIMRPDNDRHLHDHPWNARTIVLRGWYTEERPYGAPWTGPQTGLVGLHFVPDEPARQLYHRGAGYTGRLLYGQYHRIDAISEGGVWTLFFTWRYRGPWGFLVDGSRVHWKQYANVGYKADEPKAGRS